ncbi:hypothetical protein PUN28_020445 [Cardiocondyla obscurior]|uniref:Uncharacterized protein n=1 Tax=Cardiocondyla obscurior TaxID=286306 RepID=A0AAW2E899_9HYME
MIHVCQILIFIVFCPISLLLVKRKLLRGHLLTSPHDESLADFQREFFFLFFVNIFAFARHCTMIRCGLKGFLSTLKIVTMGSADDLPLSKIFFLFFVNIFASGENRTLKIITCGHLLTSPHNDTLPDFDKFFRLSISLLLVKVKR